jgi:hypothetical protein
MCRLILYQITRGVSRKPGQYSKGLEFIAATFDADMVTIFIAVWSRKGTTPQNRTDASHLYPIIATPTLAKSRDAVAG